MVLDSDALAPLLQHASISQQPLLVCRLLCTCKPLQAAIAMHLRGQVPVKFAPRTRQPIDSFGAWLASNGVIVQSLDLDLQCLADYRHAAADRTAALAAIATGLQQAAHGGAGLQLQSYISSATSSGIFQVLPASRCHLTRLDPGACCHPLQGSSASQARQALAALTALRQLALHGTAADVLLPAVPGLACLTLLCLAEMSMSSVPQLQHLPVQLKSFSFSTAITEEGSEGIPLQLAHLTALTGLGTTGSEVLQDLEPDDVLPANIEVLHVADCCGQHYLPQLRVLKLTSCTLAAGQLLQLVGSSRQLTEVMLGYNRDTAHVAAAAAAWPALPLKVLNITGPVTWELEPAPVQQLSKLQGLVSLVIANVSLHAEVLGQLAAAVPLLTGLTNLQLGNLKVNAPLPNVPVEEGDAPPPQGDVGAAAQCMGALVRATARLPRLQRLYLAGLLLRPEEAAQLEVATQLRALSLADCHLGDYAISSIACSLTGLQELSLAGNPVTDGVMPVIAKGLQKLTGLYLVDTMITNLGVRALSRLCGLRVLDIGCNARITGDVLPALAAGLVQLTHLNVSCTSVTGDALLCLTSLRHLAQLNVQGNGITVKAWLQALRQYVPRVGDNTHSGSSDIVLLEEGLPGDDEAGGGGGGAVVGDGDNGGGSSSSEEEGDDIGDEHV